MTIFILLSVNLLYFFLLKKPALKSDDFCKLSFFIKQLNVLQNFGLRGPIMCIGLLIIFNCHQLFGEFSMSTKV